MLKTNILFSDRRLLIGLQGVTSICEWYLVAAILQAAL